MCRVQIALEFLLTTAEFNIPLRHTGVQLAMSEFNLPLQLAGSTFHERIYKRQHLQLAMREFDFP